MRANAFHAFLRVACQCCFFGLVSAAACSSATTAPVVHGKSVLFVGNSLTIANDLPLLLRQVAIAGSDTVLVGMEAANGTALIDHLNGASNAVESIRSGAWDVVILQQGPTPSGICRDSLVLWTQMFDPLIRKSGAQTAVMMTWPSAGASVAYFDQVSVSFRDAAAAVGGILLPSGEAWRIAWAAEPALALYDTDGFHPSQLGSLLAAIEIYGRLFNRDVRTIAPDRVRALAPAGTSTTTVQLLLNAAFEANQRFAAPTQQPTAIASITATTC